MNGTNGSLNGAGLAPTNPVLGDRGNTTVPGEGTVQLQGSRKFAFRKAVKFDAKLRLALAGPGGSGKTYTLLKLAAELGGRVAVVDSEHGSASKYADQFEFDVLELDAFDPAIVPDLIVEVASAGYATLIFDGLSPFWNGKDGELEQVDNIAARSKSGNSFAAWRQVTPKHNQMVDAMLSAPIHILVSMRVKTEWVVEKGENGKSTPRKIGMQPVMRDGIEYEFDVCGDMDQENNMIVSKSRCPKLSGKVCAKPGREVAMILRDWLASPDLKPAPPPPVPKPAAPAMTPVASDWQAPWSTFGEMKECYMKIREAVGETDYDLTMERYGWKCFNDIRSRADARACYRDLEFLAERARVIEQQEVA